MSHLIRVSDEVYVELVELLERRESFGKVIERLVRVYKTLDSVSRTLGPSHYLKERPKEEVKQ